MVSWSLVVVVVVVLVVVVIIAVVVPIYAGKIELACLITTSSAGAAQVTILPKAQQSYCSRIK